MSLFGPSRKKAYVFVLYKGDPPDEPVRQDAVSRRSGRAKSVVFGDALELRETDVSGPVPLRDAYAKAICSVWLAQTGVGSSGEMKWDFQVEGAYLVVTVSGDLD
jgi:hypothetical protein